jgi:hypothetical protein
MEKSPHELLAELDDRLVMGEIMDSDYEQMKAALIAELEADGHDVGRLTGSTQRAEVRDAMGASYCFVPGEPFICGESNKMRDIKCSYYMAKHLVTVREFETFLDQTGYDYSLEDRERMHLVSPEPFCPVSHVSWVDAKAYCRWLRKVTKEYYSLPSEMEWEKAARGIDGRYYPWGDESPAHDLACYQGEIAYEGTVPIGSFPDNRSPHGVMDMVGNVWEFCLDSIDDPRDPHILRGGSWCNGVEYANCLSRTFTHPANKRIDFGGFRVIYLPEDLLVDYRKVNAPSAKPKKKKLKVIRLADAAQPAAEKRPAQQPAAERPQSRPQQQPRREPAPTSSIDVSIRDQLIEQLTRKKGPDETHSGDSTVSPPPPLKPLPKGAPSVKPRRPVVEILDTDALAEEMDNQSEALLNKDRVARSIAKVEDMVYEGFERDEDEDEDGEIIEIPPTALTYVALVTWAALLLTALTMFTRHATGM